MTVLPINPRIVVLGAGAWGTAIALSITRAGRHAVLWAHTPDLAREIINAGENRQFLPGFPLLDTITVTADDESIARADILFSVIPSEFLRPTMARLRTHMHTGQVLVSATKGVENGTFLRMTQVIASSIAETGLTLPIGALSGPSFAREVAEGQPTVVTVAFDDHAVAALVQREISSESLRLYTSAAGLITRGIAEITRLAVACGGRRETLAGLSGLGDLVLTCTGDLSRNRTVGMELGQG